MVVVTYRDAGSRKMKTIEGQMTPDGVEGITIDDGRNQYTIFRKNIINIILD